MHRSINLNDNPIRGVNKPEFGYLYIRFNFIYFCLVQCNKLILCVFVLSILGAVGGVSLDAFAGSGQSIGFSSGSSQKRIEHEIENLKTIEQFHEFHERSKTPNLAKFIRNVPSLGVS